MKIKNFFLKKKILAKTKLSLFFKFQKKKFDKKVNFFFKFKNKIRNSGLNFFMFYSLKRKLKFLKKNRLILLNKFHLKHIKLQALIQKRIRLLKKRFRSKNQLDSIKFSTRKFKFLPKFCIIKKSVSNIFVTLLDINGAPFFNISGGNFNIKKKREIKSTATALKLGESVLLALRKRKGFLIFLIISYPIRSFILRSFLHAIKKDRRLKIKYIINLQKFAHNGCRFRKKKRN